MKKPFIKLANICGGLILVFTNSFAHSQGTTTIRGASLVLGALEILENNKDLFHIRYKEVGSDEEKLVLSQYVPQRPDQWKTGMLFRYFETRDGYHFLRGFNNEADFQVFNQ